MNGSCLGECTDVFRALSDNSPNMIFINDFEGVVYANLMCTKVLGYSQEEFLSPDFNFQDLITPESWSITQNAFSKHRQGIDVDPYEYELVTKTGERIDVIISTKIVQWKDKPAILGTVTDISDYKRLERQLRESEEKYLLLLDSSRDGVFGIKENQLVYANKTAAEMLGYDSLDELLDVPIFDIVAPEFQELVIDRTEARLRGDSPPNRYEVSLVRQDGGNIMVEFNVSSVQFEGGPMNLTVARDISEIVRHRNRLTALLGHGVKLVSANNIKEIISMTLDAMQDALDFQYSSYLEVDGNDLLIHSRFNGSEGMRLPLNGPGLTVRAANTKRGILVHDTRQAPDYYEGNIYSLSELDIPIIVGETVVGVLNVESKKTHAFTENDMQILKLLSIHVSSAIDRLNKKQEVESLREEQFQLLIEGYKKTSAAVRHDLRSPLMTIINAVNVLNIQSDNQQMKELLMVKAKFIEAILEDWKHLTHNGEINRINVNIHSLFKSIEELVTIPELIEVKMDVDESTEYLLDNNSMIRVISNLVKNSVEAIDGTGEISLSSELDEKGLTIKVSDNGEGIKDELLPQVFTPFFTTKDTGTGIGLSYVKETVEAHGGTVNVWSTEGVGTTVEMIFPILP